MRYANGISTDRLDSELLSELEMAEVWSRREFVITSAFREGDERTHGAGEAVDIRCHDSNDRWHMVRGLMRTSGIVRVGLYSRHIHVDIGCFDGNGEVKYPQESMWLGGASK